MILIFDLVGYAQVHNSESRFFDETEWIVLNQNSNHHANHIAIQV